MKTPTPAVYAVLCHLAKSSKKSLTHWDIRDKLFTRQRSCINSTQGYSRLTIATLQRAKADGFIRLGIIDSNYGWRATLLQTGQDVVDNFKPHLTKAQYAYLKYVRKGEGERPPLTRKRLRELELYGYVLYVGIGYIISNKGEELLEENE